MNKILDIAIAKDASDIHLIPGNKPILRITRALIPIEEFHELQISNEKLCFSKMTFPHQLIRVFLLEQLFRSFKIINNETYHK